MSARSAATAAAAVLCASAALARAQPLPAEPPEPAEQPTPAPAPSPTPAPTDNAKPAKPRSPRVPAPAGVDQHAAGAPSTNQWLSNQADRLDESGAPAPHDTLTPTSHVGFERARALGLFAGGRLAYATTARLDVGSGTMSGQLDFHAVLGGELQVGYRFLPWLSAGLVPHALFNLKPANEPSARELGGLVQATGHFAVAERWDIDAFLGAGYGVLNIPGADDARGFAYRWGAGPVFHLNGHLSVTTELTQDGARQHAERSGHSVAMNTSFVLLAVGLRVH